MPQMSMFSNLRYSVFNPAGLNIIAPATVRSFSFRSRKTKAALLANRSVKKYKLKTKKSLQKRMKVVGSFQMKAFKYFAAGHRHLMRNKTRRQRKFHRTRHVLTCIGDQRRAKRLLPYFKRKKFLKS